MSITWVIDPDDGRDVLSKSFDQSFRDPAPRPISLWRGRWGNDALRRLDALIQIVVQSAYQGTTRYSVTEIILHCADTRPDWMAERPIAEKVTEIRRWHIQQRGWRDIGYTT